MPFSVLGGFFYEKNQFFRLSEGGPVLIYLNHEKIPNFFWHAEQSLKNKNKNK